MKIRNHGLVWLLVVGIPVLFLCAVGLTACLLHFDWLASVCARCLEEINNGGNSNSALSRDAATPKE